MLVFLRCVTLVRNEGGITGLLHCQVLIFLHMYVCLTLVRNEGGSTHYLYSYVRMYVTLIRNEGGNTGLLLLRMYNFGTEWRVDRLFSK